MKAAREVQFLHVTPDPTEDRYYLTIPTRLILNAETADFLVVLEVKLHPSRNVSETRQVPVFE